MIKPKLLVTAPIKRFAKVVDLLSKNFEVTINEYLEYNKLEKIIHKFDILIPNARIKIDKNILNNSKNLKVIYQPSIGHDHLDLKSIINLKIKFDSIGNDKGFLSKQWTTAEHTMMLILNSIKNFKVMIKDLEAFKWDNRKYVIRDLKNMSVGIIGFGNIGSKVFKLLKNFNCTIYIYDPYVSESKIGKKYYCKTLNELLIKSDLITLHTPLNTETRNMISSKEINIMKSSAIIVNAARGGIINENAFIKAIKDNKISGGAFDVLENENPYGVENSKLAKFAKKNQNIIITPHVGGSSFKYMESVFTHSAERIKEMYEK
tara:strand:+ start:174 stop:1130 length:957 start_codon:yes stop_codon:yes gene_type:complete